MARTGEGGGYCLNSAASGESSFSYITATTPALNFHARHNEHSVTVGINDLVPYKGSLPSRDWRLVRAWAIARRHELLEAWERAERKQDPGKIDPLD